MSSSVHKAINLNSPISSSKKEWRLAIKPIYSQRQRKVKDKMLKILEGLSYLVVASTSHTEKDTV